MARYKYSENTKEVTDIYFDTETHGEFMGMEQGGEMKKVTTARIKEKLLGEVTKAIDDALEPIENDIADLEGEGRTIETVKGNAEAISGHIEDTENPHEVTKTQVGLGNADNTSDANKPVSTAQQTALNLKEDKSNKVTAFQEEPTDTAYPSEKLVDTRFKTLEGTGEGSVKKAIDDAVSPLEEDITDHESRIELLEGLQPLETWEDVQKVAKAGFASKYLKAGDLIETTYAGSPAVVEVVGINQDTPPEGTTGYKDVVSFHFKDCLQNAQYSAPQALFNAVEGLSAGTYTFVNSTNSLPYTFTLNQAVPAGGVIVITSWGAGAYEPTVLKTMQADRLTDIETGVAVTQASGGTALAPVNLTPRCRYGANLYIESGIRHFLNDNSDSYLWMAQGLYDMPSTYGAGGGFLKRLDADFASVIGPVVKNVARATADGGGQDTFEDKVWLLSRVEMGYGTEGVTTGEQVYERWNGATSAERIKLLSGSPRYWWLRPPYVSNQNYARGVNTDGTLGYNSSSYSNGLAPGLAVY